MPLMFDRIDRNRLLRKVAQANAETGYLPTGIVAFLEQQIPVFEVSNVARLCNLTFQLDEAEESRPWIFTFDLDQLPALALPFDSYWMEWQPVDDEDIRQMGRFGLWCSVDGEGDDRVLTVTIWANGRNPQPIGRWDMRIDAAGRLIEDPGLPKFGDDKQIFELFSQRPKTATILEDPIVTEIVEAAQALRDSGNDAAARQLLYDKRVEMEAVADQKGREFVEIIGHLFRLVVLLPLIHAHGLLGCKNVTTEPNRPSQKMSKAFARRHGAPLVAFRTLVVQPMGSRSETTRFSLGDGMSAMHIVRGHFKTYTPEAPLFGSLVGTYWWSANLRGNAERGVIVKDYEVREQTNS